MSTDWELVRTMMGSAIDACERLETLGVNEHDRATVVEINGHDTSVFDLMTAAWIYPESLAYQIVRHRHEAGTDQPYVQETSRIIVNVARACAELVGAGRSVPLDNICSAMVRWYDEHALPGVELAVKARPETV